MKKLGKREVRIREMNKKKVREDLPSSVSTHVNKDTETSEVNHDTRKIRRISCGKYVTIIEAANRFRH